MYESELIGADIISLHATKSIVSLSKQHSHRPAFASKPLFQRFSCAISL